MKLTPFVRGKPDLRPVLVNIITQRVLRNAAIGP
jgi:hypothetical protein